MLNWVASRDAAGFPVRPTTALAGLVVLLGMTACASPTPPRTATLARSAAVVAPPAVSSPSAATQWSAPAGSERMPAADDQAPLPPVPAPLPEPESLPPQVAIIDEPVPEIDEEEDFPTYDVPIILNASVEAHIDYFNTRIRDKFELWLSRSGRYLPLMREIFRSHGLPEDLVFVALIESGFNPYAYSRARAVGPWQFMKGTGRKYNLRIDEWIDERRDPVKSTHAAAAYLKDLYAMFNSWPLALASYNAGEGRVGRAMARSKADDFWDLRSTHYLRPETRNYVPKFMAATIIAKNPEKYGFTLNYHEPLSFDQVTIDRPTDLKLIAKAAGVSYEAVKELNPELRQSVTPINYDNYQLKLPSGTKTTFEDAFAKIPEWEKSVWVKHRVRRGETLASVARKYGTTVATLRDINHMKGSNIRVGATILVPTGNSTDVAEADASPRTSISSAALVLEEPLAAPKPFRYRVKRGDSLWSIAKRFNTSVADIRKWNGLGSKSTIRVGQRLRLYVNAEQS
ncbi:MAG: LysM peptidoglycan-binding domain-containing protein [Nitrospirota bacterium]